MANNLVSNFHINWERCLTYDEAKDHTEVIYLHAWGDAILYWGKALNSFFGGSRRLYKSSHRSGRYNTGYSHWIKSVLEHGGSLYIGKIVNGELTDIDAVECYLIKHFPSEYNNRKISLSVNLRLKHSGDVPTCLI